MSGPAKSPNRAARNVGFNFYYLITHFGNPNEFMAHASARQFRGARRSLFHRDALVYMIGDGTGEIQRNVIARNLEIKI